MPKKETEDNAVVIDVDEFQAQLNLPEDTAAELAEIKSRFAALNNAFGELLLYMNEMDERFQRLAGDPVVTATVHTHIGADGVSGLNRARPTVPEILKDPIETSAVLTNPKKSTRAKMVAP